MMRKAGFALSAALCSVLVLSSSCDPGRSVVAPAADVHVAVDSATYHLQPVFSWFRINLRTTIANDSDHSIFIAASCAQGRRLRRADSSDKRQLLLGDYECIEEGNVEPIRIPGGTSFVDTWMATGSNSPQTRPPITIEDNTGRLMIAYVLTDSAGKGIGTITSQPFDVVPPVPVENPDTLRMTSGVGLRVLPDSLFAIRGGDRSYTNVPLRVYNRRAETIAINQCGWRVDQNLGASWGILGEPYCPTPTDDVLVAPGDSINLTLKVIDSPEAQSLYHREPLGTGSARVVIEVAINGGRQNIESNTFAIFVGGYELPDITGVLTSIGADSVSGLIAEDPSATADHTSRKVEVTNLLSLIDKAKARPGCVVSVWYDKTVPLSGTYPQSATGKSARVLRCP